MHWMSPAHKVCTPGNTTKNPTLSDTLFFPSHHLNLPSRLLFSLLNTEQIAAWLTCVCMRPRVSVHANVCLCVLEENAAFTGRGKVCRMVMSISCKF